MRIRVLLILGLGVCGVGCDFPGKPDPADRPQLPDQVLDFPTLYRMNCSGCHGANGELGPAPPLNSPLFLAIVPTEELSGVIAAGRPGTPMPAFARDQGGPLTNAQVEVLATGLKGHWGTALPNHPELPPYLATDKPADGDRTERGAKVFEHACSMCHGAKGEGAEMAGAIADRSFLSLISVQALRRYVITGRPDLGMPDYATGEGRPDGFQPLTPAEIDDLVGLLADWKARAAKSGD
jgi:cytochrome c oxidase cbb3-type subunit III